MSVTCGIAATSMILPAWAFNSDLTIDYAVRKIRSNNIIGGVQLGVAYCRY